MNKTLMTHVVNYEDIYKYVSEQPRSEDELEQFMIKGLKKGDSTARTFIRGIRNNDAGLFVIENGLVVINKVQAQVLVDQILAVLSLPRENEEISKMAELSGSLETENLELKKEIVDLKKNNKSLQKQLKQSNAELMAIKDATPKLVYQSINQKVLIPESVNVGPSESPRDEILRNDISVLIDVEEPILQSGGERESFYEEIPPDVIPEVVRAEDPPGKELTEENYHKRSLFRILTNRLLKRRVEENEAVTEEIPEPITLEILQTEKIQPSAKELAMQQFRVNQKRMIQSIADNKQMTNQEKLAMYGFYSDYHGKDMEQLINYAGDHCIHANFLMQLLESPGRACSVENTKEMLRQFKKSSEFREKLDFAKELIEGEWYITAQYNDHITKFQLVPLEEFNELRKAVGLPISEFGYKGDKVVIRKESEKQEEEKKEEEKPAIKAPEGVKTFNDNEDAEEEIPDGAPPEPDQEPEQDEKEETVKVQSKQEDEKSDKENANEQKEQ